MNIHRECILLEELYKYDGLAHEDMTEKERQYLIDKGLVEERERSSAPVVSDLHLDKDNPYQPPKLLPVYLTSKGRKRVEDCCPPS